MTKQITSPFRQITIIGVGLIGGSLALAIKQRFPTVQIVGVDKTSVLKRALKRHAIDAAEKSIELAVRSAELVILAAPISKIKKILPQVAKNCSPNSIVTDTGSVKGELVQQAQKLFPNENFIGGHPMAGSESSGIEAAHPLLFQNAIYILTPTKSTDKRSLKLLAEFYNSLDARVFIMDASVHDSAVAAVSHLPQLAAVALTNTVGKHHPDAPSYLALAAGGFRDMTRIASSPFDMWNDILAANHKEIEKALELYIKQLKKVVVFTKSKPSLLKSEFESSRTLRTRIPRSMKGFISPLIDLFVFIEDKPGELARLTTALAKKKINIKDMELLKVREGRGGTFRLSFDNRSIAAEAIKVLQRSRFDVGGK